MNTGQLDNGLIVRLRAGDRQALKEIYLYHYNKLFFFAYRLVRDAADANDITSECFVKLWREHARFKNVANVRGFLYLTCRNACFDILRSRQSHMASHKEIRYLSREGELAGDGERAQVELLKEIGRQVERLPPRCREVFKLIFFNRKKAREVAELLGLSLSTVHRHRASALNKLRNVLLQKDLFYHPFQSD
ncbi:MAG: sigma-70 family RNA polymerase sigma factor [Chitinophagaceae bacterium]|nr:sigma-70 family RNA polymerase sigma factor [Chitinophagaceae bacterium]